MEPDETMQVMTDDDDDDDDDDDIDDAMEWGWWTHYMGGGPRIPGGIPATNNQHTNIITTTCIKCLT